MKKTIIAVLSVLLAMTLLLCSCNGKPDEPTSTEPDTAVEPVATTSAADKTTDGVSTTDADTTGAPSESATESSASAVSETQTTATTETTTAQATTAKPTETTTAKKTETTTASGGTEELKEDASGDLATIKSRTFYMAGTMYDGYTTSPMAVAVDGESMYMATTLDSKQIGILRKDDKTYLISPADKVYLEMSGAVLQTVGLSEDALNFDLTKISSDESYLQQESIERTTLNGKSVTVSKHKMTDGSGYLWRYMDGPELLRLENYNNSGNLTSYTSFDNIQKTIPDGLIDIPSDYKKVSLMKFVSTLGIEE